MQHFVKTFVFPFCQKILSFFIFWFLVPQISADEVKRRTTEEGFVGDGGNNLLPQKCFFNIREREREREKERKKERKKERAERERERESAFQHRK